MMDIRQWITLSLLLLASSCYGWEDVHVLESKTTHNQSSNGAGGEECTKLRRRCIVSADCIDNKCTCPDDQYGNGLFECIHKDNYLCMMAGDPHLQAFGGARSHVNLPCTHRLTRFVTSPQMSSTKHAYCSVEVYVTNELSMGRYYVHTVLISLGLTDSGEQSHNQFEILKFGISNNRVFKYTTTVDKTSTVWGSSDHMTVNGIDIYPTFDTEDNFAVLDIPDCDTRIKFRAHNLVKKHHEFLPGVSVMAPHNAKFVSSYGEYPHSACGVPSDSPHFYSDRAKTMGIDNSDLLIIHDILLENANQKSHRQSYLCSETMENYILSKHRIHDLNFCGPILSDDRQRKCIEDNGAVPLDIFNKCLMYITDDDSYICLPIYNISEKCFGKWKGPSVFCP